MGTCLDHQVLAYDMDAPTTGRVRIRVYDMNCPGVAQTIALDLEGPTLAPLESCPGARGPLQGLFCETYLPAAPP